MATIPSGTLECSAPQDPQLREEARCARPTRQAVALRAQWVRKNRDWETNSTCGRLAGVRWRSKQPRVNALRSKNLGHDARKTRQTSYPDQGSRIEQLCGRTACTNPADGAADCPVIGCLIRTPAFPYPYDYLPCVRTTIFPASVRRTSESVEDSAVAGRRTSGRKPSRFTLRWSAWLRINPAGPIVQTTREHSPCV